MGTELQPGNPDSEEKSIGICHETKHSIKLLLGFRVGIHLTSTEASFPKAIQVCEVISMLDPLFYIAKNNPTKIKEEEGEGGLLELANVHIPFSV